jgi:flagellar basal body-associated protein FliL
MRKATTIIITIIIIVLIGFIYWHYFFVFAEGTKAGVLNTFQKKGYLFKTYEGQLIQSGFRGNPGTAIQSNQFSFSVTDEKIAQKLMENSGRDMELHYKRYQGSLPWRGMQLFVIDSIYRISNENNNNTNSFSSP